MTTDSPRRCGRFDNEDTHHTASLEGKQRPSQRRACLMFDSVLSGNFLPLLAMVVALSLLKINPFPVKVLSMSMK